MKIGQLLKTLAVAMPSSDFAFLLGLVSWTSESSSRLGRTPTFVEMRRSVSLL